MAHRFRRYACTLSILKEPENDPIEWESDADVRYVIAGKEKGEGGFEHYQIYMELLKALSIRQMKERFSPTAHFEGCAGTQAQNQAYCRKEDANAREAGVCFQHYTRAGAFEVYHRLM